MISLLDNLMLSLIVGVGVFGGMAAFTILCCLIEMVKQPVLRLRD